MVWNIPGPMGAPKAVGAAGLETRYLAGFTKVYRRLGAATPDFP